jgi:hypothetical protein
LDGAADLLVAADDGVEFALAGEAGEIAAVLLEGFVGGFRIGGGDALAAANGLEGGEKFVFGNAELLEDLGGAGLGLLAQSGEQKVFDAEVFVLVLLGGCGRAAEEGLKAWSDINAAAGRAGAGDRG